MEETEETQYYAVTRLLKITLVEARANSDSVKAMVREAPLGKAGQVGVTKLKGRSVNERDGTDYDGDDNNDNSDNDDEALSKAGISRPQARCSIIFGVEKYKEYTERFLQGTGATGGLKRRDRLSLRR